MAGGCSTSRGLPVRVRKPDCIFWLLSGPGASGRSAELANALDRIVEAAPDPEVDRRLRWQEQNRVIRLT